MIIMIMTGWWWNCLKFRKVFKNTFWGCTFYTITTRSHVIIIYFNNLYLRISIQLPYLPTCLRITSIPFLLAAKQRSSWLLMMIVRWFESDSKLFKPNYLVSIFFVRQNIFSIFLMNQSIFSRNKIISATMCILNIIKISCVFNHFEKKNVCTSSLRDMKICPWIFIENLVVATGTLHILMVFLFSFVATD